MGFLEELDRLDLSDDQKDEIRRQHEAEVKPLKEQNSSLKRTTKRQQVEDEIDELRGIGFSDAPSLLKYVRRIYLSDDAEEPGAVLLSDSDMGLSGDDATGATGKEEVSVAGALREFIKLMPRTDEGRLKIALSEQVLDNDDDAPETGDDGDKSEKSRENLSKITGRPVKRTRSRYSRGIAAGSES